MLFHCYLHYLCQTKDFLIDFLVGLRILQWGSIDFTKHRGRETQSQLQVYNYGLELWYKVLYSPCMIMQSSSVLLKRRRNINQHCSDWITNLCSTAASVVLEWCSYTSYHTCVDSELVDASVMHIYIINSEQKSKIHNIECDVMMFLIDGIVFFVFGLYCIWHLFNFLFILTIFLPSPMFF